MRRVRGLWHTLESPGGSAPARSPAAIVIALGTPLVVTPAYAIDLANATPPVEIVDHKITSGPRTLALPPGHWFLVDLSHDAVSSGASGASVADTATFVQVEDGRYVLGGRLFILRADALAFGWNFSPCGGIEDIYLKDRAPNGRQPDCLTVYSRRGETIASNPNLKPSRATAEWMSAQRVEWPTYSVVISYARYATNTFGTLSLVIPAERFESEAITIAWSESLRTALKRFFEHREDEGRLPELPQATADADGKSRP